MKAIILFFIFVIFPIFAFSQENDGNTNPKQWIENNDIVSIELYYRQQLFFTYGNYGDIGVFPIDNETAEKVIPLLKHGVKLKDANCQFMLACVLSGNKTIRGYDDEYNEIKIPTSKDYKYLDDAEARRYFQLYLSNPKMDKENGAFGYKFKEIETLIENAYPDLMKSYKKKDENSTAPSFGLG